LDATDYRDKTTHIADQPGAQKACRVLLSLRGSGLLLLARERLQIVEHQQESLFLKSGSDDAGISIGDHQGP